MPSLYMPPITLREGTNKIWYRWHISIRWTRTYRICCTRSRKVSCFTTRWKKRQCLLTSNLKKCLGVPRIRKTFMRKWRPKYCSHTIWWNGKYRLTLMSKKAYTRLRFIQKRADAIRSQWGAKWKIGAGRKIHQKWRRDVKGKELLKNKRIIINKMTL